MAKTNAEKCREKRERRKREGGEEYILKERQRLQRYYDSVTKVKKTDKETSRRKDDNESRKKVQVCRKQKLQIAVPVDKDVIGAHVDQEALEGPQAMSTVTNVARCACDGKKRTPPRRCFRPYRKVRTMKSNLAKAKKEYQTLQRKYNRLKSKTSKSNGSSAKAFSNGAPYFAHDHDDSPRKRTEALMETVQTGTENTSQVRKQLLMGNVIMGELQSKKGAAKSNQNKALCSLISGNTVKKYRAVSWLSKTTGFSRKALQRSDDQWFSQTKRKRKRTQAKYKDAVNAFLERDDNSRNQPGKADTTKGDDGEKKQTRVLTDYLSNLHAKFMSENIDVQMSLATFCRMRPKHMKPTCFISRSTCQCTKHENMALLLKSLRREGVTVSTNPETYIKNRDDLAGTLNTQLPDIVHFGQWQRVKIDDKGKEKVVTKIVDQSLTKMKFLDKLESQTDDFVNHVFRAHKQLAECRSLKQNLAEHDMVVHMDFAENYTCRSLNEVQSAYWNQTTVTLHPAVVYYKGSDSSVEHQSYAMISDETSHAASTVITMINALVPKLKEIDPQLERIHYWTDSPTSQYRNKTIFSFVANHTATYGVHAVWNYFECGHGKGVCDGLGGTTKRMADEAVNAGKVNIQDALAFFDWGRQSSMQNVHFMFVSSNDCKDTAAKLLQERALKPIKGTFQIHAVVGLGDSKIATAPVSCYCNACQSGNRCQSWTMQTLPGSRG